MTMGGKSLDDFTFGEQIAYEQGASDTHERYARAESYLSGRVANVLNVIAAIEHGHIADDATANVETAPRIAELLREALAIGETPLKCSCEEPDGGTIDDAALTVDGLVAEIERHADDVHYLNVRELAQSLAAAGYRRVFGASA